MPIPCYFLRPTKLQYSMSNITFALIKERKNPPDRRVVFSPSKLKDASKAHAKLQSRNTTGSILLIP